MHSPYLRWKNRYREILCANRRLLFLTLLIFLTTAAAGWGVALVQPDMAGDLIPDRLLDGILGGHSWFHPAHSDRLAWGLWITGKNVQVSLLCFLSGVFLGLGTLYMLSTTGLHVGTTLGFAYVNGSHGELIAFILGHAPLELSVILVSSLAGLFLGRAFFAGPWSQLNCRLRQAAGDGFCVLAGAVPWLLLAAALEVGVSPVPWIPSPFKLLIGLAAVSAFWFWALQRN